MSTPMKDSAKASEDRDPVPPYQASHGFANEDEERAALREFADSKSYTDPETDGSILHTGLVQPDSGGPLHPAREQARQLKEMEKAKKDQKAKEQLGTTPEVEKERKESVFGKLRNMVAGDKNANKDDSVIR